MRCLKMSDADSQRSAHDLLNRCSTLIFDFDGVILDSNLIKEEGFTQLFIDYGEDKTRQIVEYHRLNGGLSRYHKIRYFFNELLGNPVDDHTVERLANRFSEITMRLLKKSELRIDDTIRYIERVYSEKNMFVASASDEHDLIALCRHHGIDTFFDGIHGSPKAKEAIVSDILKDRDADFCVLIGDSFNDLKAAQDNSIAFIGYNNPELKVGNPYVHRFSQVAN